MALWQFHVGIIPISNRLRSRLEKSKDREALWRVAPETDWDAIIGESLGREPSWSPEIKLWGDPSDVQLTVVVDELGKMQDAFVRIDVRHWSDPKLQCLMNVLQDAGLLVECDGDDAPREPSFARVVDRIHSSRAFRIYGGRD